MSNVADLLVPYLMIIRLVQPVAMASPISVAMEYTPIARGMPLPQQVYFIAWLVMAVFLNFDQPADHVAAAHDDIRKPKVNIPCKSYIDLVLITNYDRPTQPR